jgi:hypothetical protein
MQATVIGASILSNNPSEYTTKPLLSLEAARWNLLRTKSILYALQAAQCMILFKMAFIYIALPLMVIVTITGHLFQLLFPTSSTHHPNYMSSCHYFHYSISSVVRTTLPVTLIGSMCSSNSAIPCYVKRELKSTMFLSVHQSSKPTSF